MNRTFTDVDGAVLQIVNKRTVNGRVAEYEAGDGTLYVATDLAGVLLNKEDLADGTDEFEPCADCPAPDDCNAEDQLCAGAPAENAPAEVVEEIEITLTTEATATYEPLGGPVPQAEGEVQPDQAPPSGPPEVDLTPEPEVEDVPTPEEVVESPVIQTVADAA